MAWSNWKYKLGGTYPTLSEEDYVNLVLSLQSQHYGGLIPRAEFDSKLNDVLKDPSVAIEIMKKQPPQKSTDSLLRELEALHKAKVLNDDEYEERKAELIYQRSESDPNSNLAGLEPEERRRKLTAHLDALLAEKAVTQIEYDAIKQRF
jgi:hypothetical protein